MISCDSIICYHSWAILPGHLPEVQTRTQSIVLKRLGYNLIIIHLKNELLYPSSIILSHPKKSSDSGMVASFRFIAMGPLWLYHSLQLHHIGGSNYNI